MNASILIVLLILSAIVYWTVSRAIYRSYILNYSFPEELAGRLKAKHTHLSEGDVERLIEGLRGYFLLANRHHKHELAMPSLGVSDTWRYFAANLDAYGDFCSGAFGAYRSPVTYSPLGPDEFKGARIWLACCSEEGIDPRFPEKLPSLFAMDQQLNIPGGARYSIEAGTHPVSPPFSPAELIRDIQQRLPAAKSEEARKTQIKVLSRIIRNTLTQSNYPVEWTQDDLARLFDLINGTDELLVEVFGDISYSDRMRSQATEAARKSEENANAGCCSSNSGWSA